MKRVVLCRPEGPRNVGAALRASLNFGPCELHLVAPKRPSILRHPDFEQMSHGAEEARSAIVVHGTLAEALADAHHVVGFTARPRDLRLRRDWRRAAPDLVPIGADPDERLALVFGTEETGLDREEADQCQELVHIRTSPEHTSLNLAQCVTVVLSDLFADVGHRGAERGARRLDQRGRSFLAARMKEVFADQVVYTPEAQRLVGEMIDRLAARAPLENRDAKAWHLVLKTLGSELSPTDLGIEVHQKGQRRQALLARLENRRSGESETGESTKDHQEAAESPDED